MDILENKTILITGGTGSFGKKFVEVVLAEANPKAIRIFSRDELKQFEMIEQFKDKDPHKKLRFFVGDVRDKERVMRAVDGAQIVVHAAALKQVPSCEYNPSEAIKTNILGTQNIIDAVIDKKVERAVFLSSDKAVNPVNLYGATKLAAEKLFVQGNAYVGPDKRSRLSVVRYGNVLGSRGSVVPFFLKQKCTGTLTLTDGRMTRFWITQRKAVNFVRSVFENMQGGEIFVPKMPSMKIIDLATTIAPEAIIKEVGIRPGEKINEILITEDEARHTRELTDRFIVEPEFPFWRSNNQEHQLASSSFQYASHTNKHWLSDEDLKSMIQEV